MRGGYGNERDGFASLRSAHVLLDGGLRPEVDPQLVRFVADLAWLEGEGVTVERYNSAQEPAAFVGNPDVRRALQERGSRCLPLALWDGAVVSSGAYPTRTDLARALGLAPAPALDQDGVA